jgi:hypothetical protein
MEEIIFGSLIIWVLGRITKKKAESPAPNSSSASPGPPAVPNFVTGRVNVLPWPTATPQTINNVQLLYYVSPNGRTIGPAAACSLPNKLQLKTSMISSIQKISVLASQYNQMNPYDRDGSQGDRLRDEIEDAKQMLETAYQSLKQGCLKPPAQTGPVNNTAAQRGN